jgi:DNA-binding transcriptional MerR regulator
MRIGEVARRAGVNIETLRYYERRGLLAEPARGVNGHRDYDEETVRFVKAVKEAQRLGFTLEEIAEHARLTRGGRPHEAVRTRVAQKLDEIDGRIASLRRVREELARVVGCACDSLDHCTCGAAFVARGGRDPQLGPLLHVTNGESAGNTLRQTALGGAVLSWQDVLHEGPVPDAPPAELRAVRARFLSECGWGSERSLLESLERRDRLFLRALERGTDVVLWFEPDVYDQLQLLQALALAGDARLELIQADTDLGPLQPDELEALWPARRAVSLHTRAVAREAWDAFRAPEPTALAELAGRELPALPHFGPALLRLLEELPDARTRLSRTERQLLEPLLGGPKQPVELFVASQAREEAVFLGDAWAWKRLAELVPLVEELPAPPPLGDPREFLSSRVTLTPLGRKVLAGTAERPPTDRWLGGTHVDGTWRWDAATRRLLPPGRPSG